MAVIGCLQVINAALALAAKPNSKVAQDNMDLFKEQWEKQVRVLTDAVDDITSIDDFLCVSGECYSFAYHDHRWFWIFFLMLKCTMHCWLLDSTFGQYYDVFAQST